MLQKELKDEKVNLRQFSTSVVENGKPFIQQKLFFAVKMSDRDNKIVMCKYL